MIEKISIKGIEHLPKQTRSGVKRVFAAQTMHVLSGGNQKYLDKIAQNNKGDVAEFVNMHQAEMNTAKAKVFERFRKTVENNSCIPSFKNSERLSFINRYAEALPKNTGLQKLKNLENHNNSRFCF